MMGCNWRRRCTLVLWKNTFAPWSTVASDVCCLLLKALIKGLLLLFKMQFCYWAGGKLNHKGSVAICAAWILQSPAWTQGPGSEVSSAVLQHLQCTHWKLLFCGRVCFPPQEPYFCGNPQLLTASNTTVPCSTSSTVAAWAVKRKLCNPGQGVKMWTQVGPDLLMVRTDTVPFILIL